jgi:ABC-type multidrug transport system fused ATPase/permease subunit
LLAHRRLLLAAYAFSLVAEGLVVLSPLPLKYIIDHVIVQQPLPAPLQHWLPTASVQALALFMAGAMLLLAAGDAVAAGAGKMMIAKVRERLNLELRDRLMAHVQKLPPSIQTTQRSGELVLRLVGDVNVFAKLQTKFLPDAFRHLSTCALTLAMMAALEPRLALLGLVLIPALFLLVRHYNAPLQRASKNKRRYEGEVAGLAQEIIRGLPTLQALGDEAHARQRFAQINTKSLHVGVEETRLEVAIARTLQIAQGGAIALMAGAGALLVLSGQLTVGALTLFVTYIKKLMNPVEKINDLATDITRGLASGEQLLHLLEKYPTVQDAPGAIAIGRARGLLEMKNVWFAYDDVDGQTAPVLRRVNLNIEPNKLTALIGASGNGKSTLFNLLLRLNEPSAGEILLDKRPIKKIHNPFAAQSNGGDAAEHAFICRNRARGAGQPQRQFFGQAALGGVAHGQSRRVRARLAETTRGGAGRRRPQLLRRPAQAAFAGARVFARPSDSFTRRAARQYRRGFGGGDFAGAGSHSRRPHVSGDHA